jgi:uncharacterized protein
MSLFGILLINMSFYTLPMFYYPPGLPHWSRPIDAHLDTLMQALGETEFLTIFSFLFGLGFSFQFSRLKAIDDGNMLFFRRVIILLAFGLCHAFLIWMGDVLVWYAVAAVVLFLFRNTKPSKLLIAAAAILVFRIARLEWMTLDPSAMLRPEVVTANALERVQECLQIYAHGSVSEIFVQRARDVWFQYTHPVDTLLHIIFVFLIGLYAGKSGVFQACSERSRRLFTGLWYFGIVFGVGGHLLKYGLSHFHLLANMLEPPLSIIADLALATFYVTSVVLAMTHAAVARLLKIFAPIGRSTLTNYLCQSVIVTTLAYSYGFGLYGKLTPVDWVALSVVIYGAQVVLSYFWLARYAYGPAEWLSRVAVYGKRLPLRLARTDRA